MLYSLSRSSLRVMPTVRSSNLYCRLCSTSRSGANITYGSSLDLFLFLNVGIAKAEEQGIRTHRTYAEQGNIGMTAQLQYPFDISILVHLLLSSFVIKITGKGRYWATVLKLFAKFSKISRE